MTLTSQLFFIFLIAMVAAYYLLPWFQKYILLIGGFGFYFLLSSMSKGRLAIIIVYVWAVTYLGAILIERAGIKAGSDATVKAVTSLTLTAMIVPLFVFKYAYNLATEFAGLFNIGADFSFLQFATVAGMSYYMLSAMGYVIEVAWGSIKAEKNPVTVGLFIFYFPQLISGPISRFTEMKEQFEARHALKAENISRGLRRMIFGYFKLLIIAELYGRAVKGVFADPDGYSGIGIVVAAFFYIIQLYGDFSGCIDICMGASILFDIKLPENFRAPFLATSVREYWHRWHITLGEWFRDYVMYPLQRMKSMTKLSNSLKKSIGKKAARNVPVYIATLIIWILIGIWHGGTAYYFLASGLIPGVTLIISIMIGPWLTKVTQKAGIRTDTAGFRVFERARTLFLVAMGWMFICAKSVGQGIHILGHIITHPVGYGTIDQAMYDFGLSSTDGILMCLGFAAIIFENVCSERDTNIYEWNEKQPVAWTLIIVFLELFIILTHAVVGKSAFIYFQL